MTDMKLSEEDGQILGYTSVAIGKTGAKSLEIGYLDDDPPSRWYATALYQGTKVTCDEQPDPVAAILGLYAMLAAGGQCTACGRTIALTYSEQPCPDEEPVTLYVKRARMHGGVYQTLRTNNPDGYCVRTLEPDGWVGCE